jgi:serine/threonine-protein kinase
VAVVATLGLLVGATGWWLGDARWTTVPGVVGMDRGAAEQRITAAGLVAAVTVVHDDTVAAGRVAAEDPAADGRLRRGGTVRLTVSSGRPAVPAVAAGTTVAKAEQAVRDAGLGPVTSSGRQEYSATVPAGQVIRTDPPAGTALPSGGAVTLVVSRGAEPRRQVRVPFLIGRTRADAVATLTALGLEVDVERGLPFGPDDGGRVVAQDHGAGSLVDPGTTITLRTL